MEEITDFLGYYQPKLLAFLDAKELSSSDPSASLQFVDGVLDDWAKFADGKTLDAPSSQERTFWFALYQIEDLVEIPASSMQQPYLKFIMQDLAEARERLRAGRELPDGLFATRPGEIPDDF